MAGSEFSRTSTFESKGITRPNTQHLMLPLVADSVSWDIIDGYTRHSKSVSETSTDWTLTRASDNPHYDYPFSNSSSPGLKVNRRRFGAAPLPGPPLNHTSPASTESESLPPPVLLLKLQKRKKQKLRKQSVDLDEDVATQQHRRKFSFRLSTPKSLGRIWGRLTGNGKGKEDQDDDGIMDFDAPERIGEYPLRQAIAVVPPLNVKQRTTRTEERTRSLYRTGSSSGASASRSTPDLSLKRSQSERRPPVPRRPLPRTNGPWDVPNHEIPPPPLPPPEVSPPPPPPPITLSAPRSMYDLRAAAQTSTPSLPSITTPRSRKSSLQNLKASGHTRSHSAVSEEANSMTNDVRGHTRSHSHAVSLRSAASEEPNSNVVRVGPGLQRSKSAVTGTARRARAGRESSSSSGSGSASVYLAFPPPKYQRGRVPPFPLSRSGSRAGSNSTAPSRAPSVQSYF